MSQQAKRRHRARRRIVRREFRETNRTTIHNSLQALEKLHEHALDAGHLPCVCTFCGRVVTTEEHLHCTCCTDVTCNSCFSRLAVRGDAPANAEEQIRKLCEHWGLDKLNIAGYAKLQERFVGYGFPHIDLFWRDGELVLQGLGDVETLPAVEAPS